MTHTSPGPTGLTLPFVGRDRELALLRTALGNAIEGNGAIALLGGEAGIGKTTLAEMTSAEALDRGALVLIGRCYDLTETAPYGPWIELFGAYPDDGSLPTIPRTVARCEIGEATTSQAAFFELVLQFLADASAERPVVLLLDDQHWADDASLDLLRFLARHVSNMPVLFLITYRADELKPFHHLSQLLPLLVRESPTLRLSLQPLASDDLWALIRPRYQLDAPDEARLTSYLYERTEGNPFFTGELLQTIEEEGILRQDERGWSLGDLGRARTPILVEQIVSRRMAHLSEQDHKLLAVAAVLGQELPLTLWAEVAQVSDDILLELLSHSGTARLMIETPDGRGARFTHALIRQVIYDNLSPARRRRWHRQAGASLSKIAAPDPDAVAYHFRQSGDSRAVEWLIRAGARAQRAYRWNTAAERFQSALNESDANAEERGWLLVRLARMRRYAAPGDGIAHLEAAGRVAKKTQDRALAGWVMWQAGLFRCLQGSIEHGIEQLEAGVAAMAALNLEERERLTEFEPIVGMLPDDHQDQGTLALWMAVAGRYNEAMTYAAPYAAEDSTPSGAEGGYGDAFVALGSAHAALGNHTESRAAYARAYAAYRDDRHHVHIARAAINELQLVVLRYETDQLTERQRLAEEAESAWRRSSGAIASDLTGVMSLPLDYLEGRWVERRAAALAQLEHGTLALRGEAAQWLGSVAHAQGDTVLAQTLVSEWLPAGPATSPGNTIYRAAQNMQLLATRLALDAGDLPLARRWVQSHDLWLEWSGAVIGHAESRLAWSLIQRAAGDMTGARQHAEAALDHANSPRQPMALIVVHRTLGEIDSMTGKYDEAASHLETALELAEACAAPYERALTLLDLAELHHASKGSAGASRPLETARPIFESLGAAPALTRADALNAKLGILNSQAQMGNTGTTDLSPSDPMKPIPADLSAREIDVLRLLPAGRTNQEIADILFLSPKTIEHHVGRILAKTNLPNRAAAAAFAQRHGLA